MEENRIAKLKQNKTLIISGVIIFLVLYMFIVSGSDNKPSKDSLKELSEKNKINLQDPNAGVKAEDLWVDLAEQKLDDYDDFKKGYTQDKNDFEERIAEIEKKYTLTLDEQASLIDNQNKEIEDLKNKFNKNNLRASSFNPNDPYALNEDQTQAQVQPLPGILNVSAQLDEVGDKEKGEFFNSREYVPAGAYASARIISGVDASVGISAQSDPRPILIRVTGPAISSIYEDHVQKADLTGCLITGAASGDISSEKVYVKLVNMTCAKSENLMFETAIKGYIAGQGKSGVRGEVIGREGDFLAKSFLAGLVSGFGSGLSSRVAPPLSFSSGVTLQNGYSNQDIAKKGLGDGVSSASDRLSNYYINRAEQYQPVITIPSGIDVEVVFVEGFHLDGKRHRTATPVNNQYIQKFDQR